MAVTLTPWMFRPVIPHGLLAPQRRTDPDDTSIAGVPSETDRAETLRYYDGIISRRDLLAAVTEMIRKWLGESYQDAPEAICNMAAQALGSAYLASAQRADWRLLIRKSGAADMLAPYRGAPVASV